MSKQTHGFLVEGLTLELQEWDAAASDWKSAKTQLCGVDSITFEDGATEEKDITDFCYAATGYRRKLSGLKEPGSLTLNVVTYDPDQDGQKLVNDAAINAKFKLTITIPWTESSEKTLTLQIQKKQDAGFAIQLGEAISSSMEFAVNGKPVWA